MMAPHIVQQDKFGCVVACLAYVLGVPYESVRSEMGYQGRGFCYQDWHTYLANHGYAVQHIWHYDCVAKAKRPAWPLKPWSDILLCAVDAGRGEGSHLIVVHRDGSVMDPACDEPRTFSFYSGVTHMTAIVKGDRFLAA